MSKVTTTTTTTTINIILIGDSDISRWPPSLYPSITPIHHRHIHHHNYGVSGAELSSLKSQLQNYWNDKLNDNYKQQHHQNGNNNNTNEGKYDIFVACAGENDIGSGTSIDQILESFRALLEELFPTNENMRIPKTTDNNKIDNTTTTTTNNNYLIFIGPKLEPWLKDDFASRKQYTKLSNGFQRAMRKHHQYCSSSSESGRMSYIDCLTLFCTKETVHVPGAVHGGKAMPDEKYFHDDGLHLSEDGYSVWKEILDKEILDLMNKH